MGSRGQGVGVSRGEGRRQGGRVSISRRVTEGRRWAKGKGAGGPRSISVGSRRQGIGGGGRVGRGIGGSIGIGWRGGVGRSVGVRGRGGVSEGAGARGVGGAIGR